MVLQRVPQGLSLNSGRFFVSDSFEALNDIFMELKVFKTAIFFHNLRVLALSWLLFLKANFFGLLGLFLFVKQLFLLEVETHLYNITITLKQY